MKSQPIHHGHVTTVLNAPAYSEAAQSADSKRRPPGTRARDRRKRWPPLLCWVLLWAGATCAGMAQSEQWLRYCMDSEPKAHRWIELTTTAPEGVALPALEEVHYFGRWTTPMDPDGGRWICLDRTLRAGPCNRLFVDCNGNGRLDDESPIIGRNRSSNATYFEPAKLVFRGEDGPITYHLGARFYQFGDDRAQLLAGSSGWYEGKVKFAGKKRQVQLVDNNVNGVFNDISSNPADSDRVVIDEKDSIRRSLGRFLQLDDRLFQIEVARDGAFMKVEPAQDVVYGEVQVPETITELDIVGENGEFVQKPEKGECSVPVGRYRVSGWAIDRKDDEGVPWKLSGYGFGEFGSFEVTADGATVVGVGEPVLAALTVTETKNGASFRLGLKGRLGESVEIQKDGKRPRAPRVELSSTGGSYAASYTFEYG